MAPLRFEQMCQFFSANGIIKISLMGGEPTVHPYFSDICKIAQTYFQEVYVFTNGIRKDILSHFHPRETDTIIYNFLFADKWEDDTFLVNSNGKRIIDVVVDHNTDVTGTQLSLKKLIKSHAKNFEVQLVINNSINIFKFRERIASNISKVYDFLVNTYPSISTTFQCGAPLCFTFGLNLPPFIHRTICPEESILIDGNFNIRFCNIHTEKLIPLFYNDNIIPFRIVKNYIHIQNLKNQLKCLEKICANCLYYSTQCNGKCYISQDTIQTEDIIKNTDVLWLKQLNI